MSEYFINAENTEELAAGVKAMKDNIRVKENKTVDSQGRISVGRDLKDRTVTAIIHVKPGEDEGETR